MRFQLYLHAVLALLLAGCGKGSESRLPEYYGVFAIKDGELVQLKGRSSNATELNGVLEFIFFDKSVKSSSGDWRIVCLTPQFRYFTKKGKSLGTGEALPDSIEPTKWIEAQEVIGCKIKPIAEQPEMIRVSVDEVVQPGLYVFKSGSVSTHSYQFIYDKAALLKVFEDIFTATVREDVEAAVDAVSETSLNTGWGLFRNSDRPTFQKMRERIKSERIRDCANNLAYLWKMQQIYISQFGGQSGSLPRQTGTAFWLALTKTPKPLIDVSNHEVMICPHSTEQPRAGFTTYVGPKSDVNKLDLSDEVGRCEGIHPDRSVVVLYKSGELKRIDSSGEIKAVKPSKGSSGPLRLKDQSLRAIEATPSRTIPDRGSITFMCSGSNKHKDMEKAIHRCPDCRGRAPFYWDSQENKFRCYDCKALFSISDIKCPDCGNKPKDRPHIKHRPK